MYRLGASKCIWNDEEALAEWYKVNYRVGENINLNALSLTLVRGNI